jgi:tRNA threonylcarbamoyl adenosine modification protein YeaZ
MILAMDTSTAACSAALFDASGACLAARLELIGRGHSERLVPLVAELLDGRVPTGILVGVGPGSFTGIRVGIAAAHGMAIGWGVEVHGMLSLALLAASAEGAPVAAAMTGGHGELFVQEFGVGASGEPGPLLNLAPTAAAAAIGAELVIGPGAAILVTARGWGTALEGWPNASHALALPPALRSLEARPLYARAPDARVSEAA